ncbi:uncharacterized protein [Prorops nasuta]|uniref:uncharacterized protein n=1 Tax=Prorops nasuta TaxID=863751 RepID=UPI0034CFE28E
MKFLVLCLAAVASATASLDLVYQWKYIDYDWYSLQHKKSAVQAGDYNYTASVIIDVDHAYDGRTFVTIIRSPGVPATLATVSERYGPGGPLLRPYPDWRWTKKGDCNGLTNVYRVSIDRCNRLWVLDNGSIDGKQICPAQLLSFDLFNDKLLERIKIPHSISHSPENGQSLLVTPVVEAIGPNCQKTYVYMADVTGGGLVIYGDNKLWRLESEQYKFKPQHVNFTIEGESFVLEDGVIGMALSPAKKDGSSRDIFFRPMASLDMYTVETSVLKKSRFDDKIAYKKAYHFLPSQAAAQAISSEGTLFLGLTTETAIACWNIYRPPTKSHLQLAVQDREKLQFASGVKVLPAGQAGWDEELWVVTNRLQKVMNGSMNFEEINFRIMRGSVKRLISKTSSCGAPYDDYMLGDGKLLFLLLSFGVATVFARSEMKVIFGWKYVDFDWMSLEQKQQAIKNNDYNLTACIPYDVDKAPDGRFFTTLVRGPGVPGSLFTISSKKGDGGNLLKPYPNWSWTNKDDCSKIISVYRVTINDNILYVLDCGVYGTDRVCPAKLLLFDLITDRLLQVIEIPNNVATNGNGAGLLVTPVLDKGLHGHNYVYIADVEGYALVVVNTKTKESWRFENIVYSPDSDAMFFNIGGNSFSIADGVLGMALSNRRSVHSKMSKLLYFRPLASYKMFWVTVNQLKMKNNQNVTYWEEQYTLPSQSAAQAISDSQILFYSLLSQISIQCWNTYEPMSENSTDTVFQNDTEVQFPSGMKTIRHGSIAELLLMSNRYQKVADGSMDFNETNFRILIGNIDDMVRGTKCAKNQPIGPPSS